MYVYTHDEMKRIEVLSNVNRIVVSTATLTTALLIMLQGNH